MSRGKHTSEQPPRQAQTSKTSVHYLHTTETLRLPPSLRVVHNSPAPRYSPIQSLHPSDQNYPRSTDLQNKFAHTPSHCSTHAPARVHTDRTPDPSRRPTHPDSTLLHSPHTTLKSSKSPMPNEPESQTTILLPRNGIRPRPSHKSHTASHQIHPSKSPT